MRPADKNRLFLFILKNGPIHNLGDHIQGQVNALSEYFDCEVWGPGSIDADNSDGEINSRIRIVRTPESGGLISRLPYLLRLMARAVSLRLIWNRKVCVLVQDPLKGGMVGVLAKWLSGGSLVVEVNGAYVCEDNYVDSLDSSSAKKKIEQIKKLSEFVLRHADGVRALYNGQMEGLGEVPDRAQFRVFFDLAPTSRFQDLGESRTVLFVGYPFYRKGVDLLIQAFEKVCAAHPGWRLQLIGHDLEGEARKFIRGDRIDVMKATSNEGLVEYIGKCGIFVLPSRSEAMGRVLLEAGAAAKPRLAADVDGIPAVVEDGVDGLLFEKENIDELAEKLSTLMSSVELRKKLGSRARERVNADFSSQVYAEKMREIIEASVGS